jgi:RimJ/RimL family protein N-acetyltransferase
MPAASAGQRGARVLEPIPGQTVYLRRPEPQDLTVLHALINDAFVASHTVEAEMPVSETSNSEFHAQPGLRSHTHLAVVERSTGATVGAAVIGAIDWRTQTAANGIKILPSASGRGLATDACFARDAFLFFRLGLRRLVWPVLDFNFASRKLALRLGYRLEGREKEAVLRNGRWCDLLTYGLLRHEAEAMDLFAAYRSLIVPVEVAAPDTDGGL